MISHMQFLALNFGFLGFLGFGFQKFRVWGLGFMPNFCEVCWNAHIGGDLLWIPKMFGNLRKFSEGIRAERCKFLTLRCSGMVRGPWECRWIYAGCQVWTCGILGLHHHHLLHWWAWWRFCSVNVNHESHITKKRVWGGIEVEWEKKEEQQHIGKWPA